MAVILGFGGHKFELQSACLVVGVEDPLGDSALGKFSEARCCNSCTGVVNLGYPFDMGCDFACGEDSAGVGVALHSRLLGFVGTGADLGGSCYWQSGWSPLGGLSLWCNGLQVAGDCTDDGGVLLQCDDLEPIYLVIGMVTEI
ncbi:hypothetical protein M0R45_030547 [Rubus argutus]|uniref:Uncharacterized protein n=1 Tax=Rubus argutus TaxID=59490 RepID=A0AAW1WFF9_RUBAR